MTDSLQKAIDSIIQVAKPDRIILFGSRASGDQTAESDYDLLVLKRNVTKPRALSQQIYLNFKNIGVPIDIIVADLDNYEKLKEIIEGVIFNGIGRSGYESYQSYGRKFS